MPRERRLQLPDRPGVYRLLRTGGAMLYVGKAASLRQRVGSHFHSRAERAMDMLTQARDVSCCETETALEAALLVCGHVHRHQVLRVDLQGRPLPAPVVYAGSVERTSFAERDEVKGFVMATVGAGGSGGRLVAGLFRPLPARPMRVHEVAASFPGPALDREIEAAVAAAPPDVVLQLRVPASLSGAEALRAARLRAVSPPGANVTVSARGTGGPGRRSAPPTPVLLESLAH